MKRHLRRLPVRMILVLICYGYCFGQSEPSRSDTLHPREPMTQGADAEAKRLVSLSADTIISILQDEPGLLLEVKTLLVKKAYEQGRMLDPDDLSDETLFRLIREDNTIRVLATQEIKDRYYVRAMPNQREREELAERSRFYGPMPQPPTSDQQAMLNARQNQEEAYWSKHDEELRPAAPAYTSGQGPYAPERQTSPGYSSPAQPQSPDQPATDSRRLLNRTAVGPPSSDNFDSPLDSNSANALMQRVSPDDLPQLFQTSALEQSAGRYPGQDDDKLGGPTVPDFTGLQRSNERAGNPTPGFSQDNANSYSATANQYPMTASLLAGRESQFRRPYSRQADQPAIRRRPNPYANVPSLYDLYAQYSKRTPALERFGDDIFLNGTGNLEQLPMDMPVGPDYVLGPGDSVSVNVWGSASERIQRVVDREGRLSLPDVGAVQVTGRTLGDVQRLVQSALQTEFRDVQADISLARLRTVRVYVVGDVERPGAYDVSSLSTPLNALYMAQGPTQRGSLRVLRHYRGKQLVQEIDVYDLLLHGIHSGLERLESGDTILVPPLGATVSVQGMVRRPAIYELHGEKSLSEVLELAGGVLPTGSLRQIDVERLVAHDHRTMLRLDMGPENSEEATNRQLDEFIIQDNDSIRIQPILPYSEKTVYLDGHVFRPGKYAYREGMKVTDVIASYSSILPEPYVRHAEIIRLNPPDNAPEVIAFNLDDALAKKDQDLALKPFDTIRIFSRFDFEDAPIITVSGAVRDPGDHATNGGSRLRDAVFLAGGATRDASLSDAQVFRTTEDGKLKVLSVNLAKALAGDSSYNIMLQPKDHVVVHKNMAKVDPPTVIIQGEVPHPGKYPLGDDMSAADLVRVAGGLMRSADQQQADLTRYLVQQGNKVVGEHATVAIADALAGAPDRDVRLRDGDVLTIRQVAGWSDIGASITVKGEVVHPGTYGIQEGERLSSIIARAGGLRTDAYPYGAIFQRAQIREIEERSRDQLIREVKAQGATLKLSPETDEDQRTAKDAALLQWQSALDSLQKTPTAGRLVVHISTDMKWANSPADIPVRAGDVIYIPKEPTLVMVNGSVYNPTAVTFKPGQDAKWYLRQAGGPTAVANKKAIFVIRADGSVVSGSGGTLDTRLEAGDMVVVPEKAFGSSPKWKSILQTSQLVSAVGIAVQVARGF